MPTKVRKHKNILRRISDKIGQIAMHVYLRMLRAKTIYNTLNTEYVARVREYKVTRILPSSLIVLMLSFTMAPIYMSQLLNNDVIAYDGGQDISSVSYETLYEGELSQKIQCQQDPCELNSITVSFGTFQRRNHANYEFVVRKNEEEIRSQTFSALSLKDNQPHTFVFKPVFFEKGFDYTFAIRALNTFENDAIAIYYESATGNIIYQATARSPFYTLAIIATGIFLTIFCIINYLINSDKINNEIQYIGVMLMYIIPLVFIYPTNTIPDEFYHFGGAIRLAQYDWSKSIDYNATAQHTIYLPASGEYCLGTIHMPPQKHKIAECLAPDHDTTTMERFQHLFNTHSLIVYAPAALGIIIGDIISDSPAVIYYCGRLANLMAVVFIIIFALSLIKKHRIILLAVIMIPMFLQQACSYSYDGILNALCILLIAYSIRFLTTDAAVRKKDIVIIMLASALVGLIKPPYILVVAPLLFIKSKKISHHKTMKWLLLAAVFAIAVAAYTLDGLAITSSDSMLRDSGRGLSLGSLLYHPRFAIGLLSNTLWTQSALYITGMIGYFGWFFFSLDSIVVAAYIIFLVIVVSSCQENFTKTMRVCTLLISIVLSGSIFLAMYLAYTTEGAPIIEGVQGRYFLPVLPLIMLAMIPKRKKISLPIGTCYAFFNFIILCYIITLLVGFY